MTRLSDKVVARISADVSSGASRVATVRKYRRFGSEAVVSRAYYAAEASLGLLPKVAPTAASVAAARKRGLRLERIAYAAGISVSEARRLSESRGVSRKPGGRPVVAPKA